MFVPETGVVGASVSNVRFRVWGEGGAGEESRYFFAVLVAALGGCRL